MPTHRQRIIELLSENEYGLQDISTEIRLSMKDILIHLGHVRKSVRPPKKFVMRPAECLNCGFVFKDRNKLHSPGKCPRCRNSHIQEPTYRIIDG